MINVSYKKEKLINEVKISGHANYNKFGKDIVCAAVSSVVTTTVNDILTLDDKAITYADKDGYILITNRDSELADKLLNTMIVMLGDIADDYPKNIKIGG